jgi:hypothetical protein
MADISIGDISKGDYYAVSTYTIVGDTAYESSNDAIRIDGLTRITMLSKIKYYDAELDFYILYSYGVVVAIIDQTGYDSIVDNLNLTELPSYTINRNEATPVGGLGNDLVDTSLFYKVRILPNITLDGTPTTMYMCLDISNNVIIYTDVVGYQDVTGLAYSEYSASEQVYNSDVNACTSGPNDNTISIYTTGKTLEVGVILYTDTNLSIPYESEAYVYITSAGNTLSQLASRDQSSLSASIVEQLSIVTNIDGVVLSVYDCSTVPTPTPTPSPTATPEPTPTETPTPTPIMSFSFSVRRNNTGSCASSPTTTIYSNSSVLETGINVYEDISLTNPLPAFAHICDCKSNLDYTVSIDNTLGVGNPTTCITPTPSISPTPTPSTTPKP